MMDIINKNTVLILTDKKDRRYFSGIDIDEGYLVLMLDKTVYFADARYFRILKEKTKKSSVVPVLLEDRKSITELLDCDGIKNVYLNFDATSISEYNFFKDKKYKIFDGKNEIDKVRSVKTEEEISYIKKACKITQKAYYETIKELRVDITENEVKEILESKMKEFGGEGTAFDTIVAFGEGSSEPHHETGNRKLKKDEAVLIDCGAKFNGYASDFTRTVFFGTPDDKFIKAYEQVLTANIITENDIISGMTTLEADSIARNFFKTANVDNKFTHSTGHGLGLDIHEFPYLSQKHSDVLEENQVFTVEPGLYFDGEFGIRIEDTLCLMGGKAVRLFDDDKKLCSIEIK